jgi:hypothetical protein
LGHAIVACLAMSGDEQKGYVDEHL